MKKHCLYFSKRPISAMRPLSVISVKAIEKNPSKEDCEKPCKYFLKAADVADKLNMNDQDRLTLATFMAGMQAARQDFFQAAKWSRQAAEPGNRKAHGMMAFFYYAGQGRVPQDTEKARYRAEKGGKSGRAGRRHGARRTGNGVPVSGQTGHERGPYVA